jgi:hypothetical protein
VDSWYTTRQCCPCPRNTYNTGAEVVCVVSAAAAAVAVAPCIQQLCSWYACRQSINLAACIPVNSLYYLPSSTPWTSPAPRTDALCLALFTEKMNSSYLLRSRALWCPTRPTQVHAFELCSSHLLCSRALWGPTRPTQGPPQGTHASASTATASAAAAAAQTAPLTTTWSLATCFQALEPACHALLAGSVHEAVWGSLLAEQHVSGSGCGMLQTCRHSAANDSNAACCLGAECI